MRYVGWHQTYQHLHNERTKGKTDNVAERMYEEIITNNFLNMIKDVNLHIQKLNEFQIF